MVREMNKRITVLVIIGMLLILSACKKAELVEDDAAASEVAEAASSEEIEEDVNSVDDDNEEVSKEDNTETKDEEEPGNKELLNELRSDSWIQQETIYVSRDESFVIYKRWIDEIDSLEFEVYLWDFVSEPVMIEEATGFATNIVVAPNEEFAIIHVGTAPYTTGVIINILDQVVRSELASVDLAVWSADSNHVVARQIEFTEVNSVDGYNENILLWEPSLDEPLVAINGMYGIRFRELEAKDSEFAIIVEYPTAQSENVLITYETIIKEGVLDLYDINARSYIEALIATENTVDQDSSVIINTGELDFAIYWDMNRNALIMWTVDLGEVILEEDQGAYTDLAVSPNNRYVALTSGTSPVRELIVFDGLALEIIYRGGPVYDSLYWSNDNRYLAFTTLNDITMNLNLEISESMDAAVLDIKNLITKVVAKGTDEHYVLVEGFRDIGLDVYEADSMFQKTLGYTILKEEIEDVFNGVAIDDETDKEENSEEVINPDGEEETQEESNLFAQVEYEFENEYATKRVNDRITELNKYYIDSGYEARVTQGYLPKESSVEQFSIYDGFISMFYTFVYENEEGTQIKLYDSLTFHSRDGIEINFDTMFKAEEIENVFSQMLRDEAANSEMVLLKEFAGFSNEAKFYFVEEGIVVYFDEGVYTTREQGPFVVTLLWEDLKGVIETSSLVY